MPKQQIRLSNQAYIESIEELSLGIYYSVDDGNTELAGIGAIILFDSNQLEFLRYEEILKVDLFQTPNIVYSEQSLYQSLTATGKTINADLDSIPATTSGIPFAYLSGSDLLFDGKEDTKWDGIVRWPGADISEAKTTPGVKLFNLVFKPKVGFNETLISTVVTSTATGYTSDKYTTSAKLNTPTAVNGEKSQSGTEDKDINGKLDLDDVVGISNVSITKDGEAKNGTVILKTSTNENNLNGIGYGTSLEWAYKPNNNFYGSDSFEISITDKFQKTSKQKINLIVLAEDDQASFTGDIKATEKEDIEISGTLTATDVDKLSSSPYSIADTNKPINGSATINATTGKWNYTPKANYSGNDFFTVTVTDSLGGISTQAVELTINPVDDQAIITGSKFGSGDANKTIKGKLLATDTEGLTDESIFSIAAADNPKNGTSSIDPKTGEWEYKPKENFADNDSFIVTITDDLGGISKETIKVLVNSPGQTSTPSEIKLLDDLDGITKNANPTVTGKAEPGAKVEIFKSEISFGNATANSDGLWSLVLTKTLDQGSNEFKVYATKDGKSISNASVPLQLILDTAI